MKAKIIALLVRVTLGFLKKVLAIVKEEEDVAAGKIEIRIIALVSEMVNEGKKEIVAKVEAKFPESYA